VGWADIQDLFNGLGRQWCPDSSASGSSVLPGPVIGALGSGSLVYPSGRQACGTVLSQPGPYHADYWEPGMATHNSASHVARRRYVYIPVLQLFRERMGRHLPSLWNPRSLKPPPATLTSHQRAARKKSRFLACFRAVLLLLLFSQLIKFNYHNSKILIS
jgi:hypothetical protein